MVKHELKIQRLEGFDLINFWNLIITRLHNQVPHFSLAFKDEE